MDQTSTPLPVRQCQKLDSSCSYLYLIVVLWLTNTSKSYFGVIMQFVSHNLEGCNTSSPQNREVTCCQTQFWCAKQKGVRNDIILVIGIVKLSMISSTCLFNQEEAVTERTIACIIQYKRKSIFSRIWPLLVDCECACVVSGVYVFCLPCFCPNLSIHPKFNV